MQWEFITYLSKFLSYDNKSVQFSSDQSTLGFGAFIKKTECAVFIENSERELLELIGLFNNKRIDTKEIDEIIKYRNERGERRISGLSWFLHYFTQLESSISKTDLMLYFKSSLIGILTRLKQTKYP